MSNKIEYNSEWVVGFIDIKVVENSPERKKTVTRAPVLFKTQGWLSKWQTLLKLYDNQLKPKICNVIGKRDEIRTRISDLPIVEYAKFIANPCKVDARFYLPEKHGSKKFVLRFVRIDKTWKYYLDTD